MTELYELEAQVSRLAAQRRLIVSTAEDLIQSANSYFDSTALPIMREISRRRKAEAVPVVRNPRRARKRQPSLEGTEDWSPEEVAHYLALQRKFA